MLPYGNNHHLIADLARERYNDRRREADAWRLAREAQRSQEAPCVQGSRLQRALMMLRLQLAGTPRSQIAVCS